MNDWSYGGWTGSINKIVRQEIKEHFKSNFAARGARYGLYKRSLGCLLSIRTFGRFLAIYAAINALIVLVEVVSAPYISCAPPAWPTILGIHSFESMFSWMMSCTPPAWLAIAPTDYVRSLLLNVGSYFITAQVGALGVLSLALALVTLIAQGQNSETDVKVYYHESYAHEIVASSLALLSVLSVQLLWPAQFLIHKLGLGTAVPIFKLTLLTIHLAWLIINLASLAHFISVTFGFVQQSKRERLRELFTANVVMPKDMNERLRHALYSDASKSLIGYDVSDVKPSITFGFDYGEPYTTEISSCFPRSMALNDVRMIWVRWVVKQWAKRCIDEANQDADFKGWLTYQAPLLWFTPTLDTPNRGRHDWCVRRGGVPLKPIERLILKAAFTFKRVNGDA